ncbi:hypothetical protein AURDEDRAFT_174716 [Auricularia subglabra TFB-10046 SS5]|nr:hypothetical protein AURDEDRAFT_174716 [Auricularia subglabra TFB-10046 SS5]
MYRARSYSPERHGFTQAVSGPDTLDNVYFGVRNVLRSLTAGLSSAESTSCVIDQVYSVVHRAVADFASAWNASAPVVLPALPSELWVSCLSWLSFRDRLVASHVSRRWRRFMLAAPSLWDTIDTTNLKTTYFPDLFHGIMDRSGDVPLDARLTLRTYDRVDIDATLALLNQASARLRSLTLSLSRYFDSDVFGSLQFPILEYLNIDATLTVVALNFPSRGSTVMPRLKHLVVNKVYLPEPVEPMLGLEIFEGHCYSDSDTRNLFLRFPCLAAVTLHNLRSVIPPGLPPSTLKAVTLYVRNSRVDPAEILRTFTRDFFAAIGVSAHLGPWHLSLASENNGSSVTAR